MAKALIFASLREAAGTSEISFEVSSLRELLEAASSFYGEAFAALLPHCTVVVNGVKAEGDMSIGAQDEIAILPPVAGG